MLGAYGLGGFRRWPLQRLLSFRVWGIVGAVTLKLEVTGQDKLQSLDVDASCLLTLVGCFVTGSTSTTLVMWIGHLKKMCSALGFQGQG